ncbi:MAG: DUF5615 family PIN-like protein [Nanoarchaeota archaeon]|nr:DUF5615 family PIN-like protein [Nanoarchaeota archaeon]
MFSSKDKLKFLSDENFPTEVTKLLIKQGHDIKKVSLGSTDKQLFKIAKSESRVILTFDKHFLNKKLFPPKESFGIVVLKITPPLINTIFSLLSKLFKEVEPSKFKGRLFIISIFAFRISPPLTKDLTK